MREKHFYNFGPYSLDASAKVLLCGNQPIHLTVKAVETLLVLVRNAGQVVTKEEIMAAVWPNRVVDEANLAQNIAVIRRALAADRGSPASIETFPGRGYRIVGPVTIESATLGPPQAQPVPKLAPGRLSLSSLRWPVTALGALLILAAAWLIFRRQTPPTEARFRILPATRLPGKEAQPAISPDSQRLAFVWTQEGVKTARIWTLAAGQTSPRPVSRREGHYSSPAWSMDGRSLAFLRTGTSSTEVVVASLDSGQERLVGTLVPPNYGLQCRLLDWSPDGQWLALSHSDSPDRVFGLFLVSVATGEMKRLTLPSDTVGGDIDPRFSPDGRIISFIRLIHRSNQELFAIPVHGGPARQWSAAGTQVSSHDWTPDGKSIVFASDRGGEFRLWRLPAAISLPAKTLQSIGIYGEFPIELSLARGASCLVYTVLQQDRNIWRLDLKDKKWTRIVASSGQDASPQYSPAGDQICFRSDRSGEDQLWVSDADGSDLVQVTRGHLFPSVGHWSPSGRAIAFNNARTGEIYVAERASDRSWSIRGTAGFGYHPVFSADGQWIYAGTQNSIVRLPASGGPASEVAHTRGISLGLSANGKDIYFMRGPHESSLWRASVASGHIWKALDGLVPSCTSCWALTPNGVYYLGSSPLSFDRQVLYFHDFTTGQDRQVIEYPEPLTPFGSGPFSLSPDLRSLLCVRIDQSSSDIMRVEPFR